MFEKRLMRFSSILLILLILQSNQLKSGIVELNDITEKCINVLETNAPAVAVKKYIDIINSIFPAEDITEFLNGWYLLKFEIDKNKGLDKLFRFAYLNKSKNAYLEKSEKIYLAGKYPNEAVVEYLKARALESFENQRLTEAVDIYKSLLKKYADFDECRWRLADIYFCLQKIDAAKDLLKDHNFINSRLLLFDIHSLDYSKNKKELINIVNVLSKSEYKDAPEILIQALRLKYYLNEKDDDYNGLLARLKKTGKYKDEIVYYDDNHKINEIENSAVYSAEYSDYSDFDDKNLKRIFLKTLDAAFDCFGFDRKIGLKFSQQSSAKNKLLIMSDNNNIIVSKKLTEYLNTHFNEFKDDAAAIIFAHEIAHIMNNDYTTKQFIKNNIKDLGARREAYIKMETEADRAGIFIGLKAGYNPKYLTSILRRFYEDFGADIEHPYYIRIINANETYKHLYLAYNLFFDGIHYFNNKRYADAMHKFILFAKFFPHHKAANNNIALIYYKDALKNYYRNFELITDIDLNIGFENPQILMRRAISDKPIRTGKINDFLLNRAINILEKITTRYPDYSRGLNNLACMYIDSGEYSKAETILNKIDSIYEPANKNKKVLKMLMEFDK